MAYKYHKEPDELHSNNARLRAPTEKEKKWIIKNREESKVLLKKLFPGVDIDALTIKSKLK